MVGGVKGSDLIIVLPVPGSPTWGCFTLGATSGCPSITIARAIAVTITSSVLGLTRLGLVSRLVIVAVGSRLVIRRGAGGLRSRSRSRLVAVLDVRGSRRRGVRPLLVAARGLVTRSLTRGDRLVGSRIDRVLLFDQKDHKKDY